jgi:hypothetical protein
MPSAPIKYAIAFDVKKPDSIRVITAAEFNEATLYKTLELI